MITNQHLFNWKDFPQWRNFIQDIFPENIREHIVEDIQNEKNKFVSKDDLYFEKFYKKNENYSELVEMFLERFCNHFSFVEMYHCCRPLNSKSYYDFGIKVLNTAEMNTKFENLFLNNPNLSQIPKTHIQAAIEQMSGSYKRSGYIYFGLDYRWLINNCSDYLIYGSEYLKGLVASISSKIGYDLKTELKEYGTPTVFKVRIPIAIFSKNYSEFREFASETLHNWAYNTAHNRTYSYEIDFTIDINHDLPANSIIEHYHPKISEISNYHNFEENQTP